MVDIVHVPYKGGQPAPVDVISGQIAYMFINTLEVLPHAKAGRLKVLAVASNKRSSVLPEIPAFAESGAPKLVAETWWGLLAPAGAPKENIARLHGEIAKGLATTEMKERITTLGAEPVGNSPEQFGAFMREEVQKCRSGARWCGGWGFRWIEAGDRWLECIDFPRPCHHQRLCNFSCSQTLIRD